MKLKELKRLVSHVDEKFKVVVNGVDIVIVIDRSTVVLRISNEKQYSFSSVYSDFHKLPEYQKSLLYSYVTIFATTPLEERGVNEDIDIIYYIKSDFKGLNDEDLYGYMDFNGEVRAASLPVARDGKILFTSAEMEAIQERYDIERNPAFSVLEADENKQLELVGADKYE